MADLKHLKVQPHGESGASDPLAELTRIMGLNPPPGSPDASSDEFGIDLEREMLGEFGANDNRAPTPVVAARGTAPAVEAPARSFAPQSTESWKTAFGEVGSASGGQPEMDRPRVSTGSAASLTAAPAPRATSAAPAAPVQAAEAPEEDPFERLAAFSRQWLDRRQPETGTAEGGSAGGSGFRMPDKPDGPASPIPATGRLTPSSDHSLRPAAPSSTASPSSVAPSPTPPSPARDRLFAAASGQIHSAAPQRVVEPEPVAAPTPGDKVFDPFAELVAMAGQPKSPAPSPAAPSSSAASVSAPAVPLRPSPQPAPAGGSSDAGPQNQSAVANPSIIARRTNWQSVPGGSTAFTPREPSPAVPLAATAVAAGSISSFTPAAATPLRPTAVEPVEVGAPEPVTVAAVKPEPAAMPAEAIDARTMSQQAAVVVHEPPAEPVGEADVAEDPTWDAISAWVSRPSERIIPPARTNEQASDEVDDDSLSPDDAEAPSVLPPVARIPELVPETADQDDFGDFGDDFDLESLLRSELEGEGLRPDAARFDDKSVGPALAATQAVPDGAPAWQPARVDAADDQAPASPTARAQADSPAAHRGSEASAIGRGDDGMPDVDTVEVPTARYVVADEIDVPELVVVEDVKPSIASDDIDADFGGGFEDRAETRPGAGAASTAAAPAMAGEARSMAAQPAQASSAHDDVDDLDAAFDEAVRSWAQAENEKETGPEAAAGAALWTNVRPEPDDFADDDGFDPEYHPVPAASYESQPAQRSRGLLVAAVVAGVAVVGGIGAFVMSLGGGEGDIPALVRADQEPVKIKPEQPGGATVPNQDKAVYERFGAGEGATQPAQERLVSTQEEPVNLAVRTVPITAPTPLIDPADAETADELPAAFGEPTDMALPKSEDRVQPADDIDASPPDEVAVIAPRRVRTMVVRPDGTLVPREEIEPEAVVVAAAEPAPAPLAQAPIRNSEAVPAPVAAENPANDTAPAPAAVQDPPIRTVETRTITREQATPTRGPVAPARPSDQPVDIIGNVGGAAQGTQVAAAQPAPVASAATSEWSMQIASQPSPEGAQASYADLSRRYAAVLNGRGVNIVKAEIAGKGTYWRVRIPAGSRAEANALCERYKAAGGSCFVSR